jgi:hypothetical protein
MTVIIAAHHQGDKTDYCQAQDLISVSIGVLFHRAARKPHVKAQLPAGFVHHRQADLAAHPRRGAVLPTV